MSDTVWMALALARLAVRCEMLEQEVAVLKQAAEAAKGPQEVKKEVDNAAV